MISSGLDVTSVEHPASDKQGFLELKIHKIVRYCWIFGLISILKVKKKQFEIMAKPSVLSVSEDLQMLQG